MALPFYTVGHSTRSLEDFVAVLDAAEVNEIIDIRTVPRSRTNPQFNADVILGLLAPHHIGYERIPELGGLRSKAKNVSPEVNGFWENRSFHNYADYALSEPFRAGLERLINFGRKMPCVVMCSEAVWWRCHRRIVADYLLAHGEAVFHLMGSNRVDEAHLTRGASVISPTTVLYPRKTSNHNASAPR